jgi:hypothetical protein
MKIYPALSKFTLFTFLLMAFVVAACNDDDDKPDPQVEDTNPIVGKWQLTSVAPETAGANIPALALIQTAVPCLLELKLTFNPNNTISTADCSAAVSAIDPFVPVGTDAKWKVENDKLILSRGTTSQEFKMTQTATNLTVVVNTQTDATKPAANAVLSFKRI